MAFFFFLSFFYFSFFYFFFLSLFQPGIWGTRLLVRQGFCLKWDVPGLPNERLWNGLLEGSHSQLTLLQEWEWLCCGWPGRMGTQQCRLLRQWSQLECPLDWANPKGTPYSAGKKRWDWLYCQPLAGGTCWWQGRALSPSTCDVALLCVWDRAVLPRKGARGDSLGVRVILKLLQWQHEFNQTPNLRSMDITLCYLSFSSWLVLCSLSISRNPSRLCVLLSICCSLFFLTGVCRGGG